MRNMMEPWQRGRRRPWSRLLALALVACVAAGAAAGASPAAAAARFAKEPFVSSCEEDGSNRAADRAFVTAAAAALAGDSRLAIQGPRFAGACAALGHAAPRRSSGGRGGGGGGEPGALASLFERAVVLSTGRANHAAGATRQPGAPGASAAALQRGDAALGGSDAAALEFTVAVAPDAPEGQQLVMSFLFATEEGARPRGAAPRADAAAVFVGPAGAGPAAERNVALLPGSGRRVDAAAVLGEGVEGLVVRNEGGAKATALAAYTQVRQAARVGGEGERGARSEGRGVRS
jgi:hypothetical protein